MYVPDTCLKSNGLKVIGLHRTTTKKYHLLRDGITQQRETEEFYDLQLTKGTSTSSTFSLPYRRSTKARANLIAVSGPRLVTAFRFTRHHICSELLHEWWITTWAHIITHLISPKKHTLWLGAKKLADMCSKNSSLTHASKLKKQTLLNKVPRRSMLLDVLCHGENKYLDTTCNLGVRIWWETQVDPDSALI